MLKICHTNVVGRLRVSELLIMQRRDYHIMSSGQDFSNVGVCAANKIHKNRKFIEPAILR